MRVADYIKAGRAMSSDYGLVAITGALPRAKAMIDIRVIQRGKGWDELSQSYKRYKVGVTLQDSYRSISWRFTQRDEYGKEDTVHINSLKPVE